MAETPNLTPEAFLRYYRDMAEAKRDLEKVEAECRAARGIYRAKLKAAKKAGVNQAQMILAHQIVTVQDEAEVTMDFRDLGRYLKYLNSPLGAQFSLFDDGSSEVPGQARDEHEEWEANEAGYRAAQAGQDVSACPFDQGTALAQVWSLGHAKGSRVLADFQAGYPAEPTKRRGRRAKGNGEIVAGAPA